ncbi:MAG: hypothetical protein AABY22_16575 [Nanoarchaeota archaeon]
MEKTMVCLDCSKEVKRNSANQKRCYECVSTYERKRNRLDIAEKRKTKKEEKK